MGEGPGQQALTGHQRAFPELLWRCGWLCQQGAEVGGSTFLETVRTHQLVKHTKVQPPGGGRGGGERCSEADTEQGCVSPGPAPKGLGRNRPARQQRVGEMG